jgi:hypothetical protein
MKKTIVRFAVVFLGAAMLFTACKKEKTPEPVNEEEVITTLNVSLTDVVAGTTETFIFKDPDGEGGSGPTQFDDIVLEAGKTYSCSLELLNESVNPAESITEEVEEESGDHQFYFVPSGANITVSNFDTDDNGWPLGINSTWTTGAASTGTIKIVLKHKPGEKTASDDISVGETDIEVTFDAVVQ